MASRNASSRLSRRIVQFSIAVVAVLVSASATSSAQSVTGRGDPDDGDVLGVNEQGAVFAEDPPSGLPADCLYSHRNYRPEPSVRSQLGLDERSAEDLRDNRDSRGEAELGVTLTPEEYARVSGSMERRSTVLFTDVRTALAETIGEAFIGAAWDPAGGDVVVYHTIPTDAAAQLQKALSDVVPEGVSITPTFVENGVGWTTAESNARLFEDAPASWFDPKDGIAIGWLDEACGQMVLYSHPGADIDALGERISQRIPEDQFLLFALPKSYEADPMARNNHHNPHRGGLQVHIDTNEGNCTSNVPWRKGNEIWAVTAGHCVNNNSPGAGNFFTVAQEFEQGNVRIDDGGANPVVYVNYNGTIEAAVARIGIGGNNFTHTGTFPNDAWTGMNWWQWDPNAPNATFVNQRQTTADGCQGDSGGTFYRNNDRTIAGLASRQFGTPSYTRHGNTCRPNTQYGHISYLKSVFGFTAPVNMS